jgi:hypothetical protein
MDVSLMGKVRWECCGITPKGLVQAGDPALPANVICIHCSQIYAKYKNVD